MKTIKKYLVLFLTVIFTFSVFSPMHTVFFIIPFAKPALGDAVLGNAPIVFADDSGFVLISSDQSSTRISHLDKHEENSRIISTLSGTYLSSSISYPFLYIATDRKGVQNILKFDLQQSSILTNRRVSSQAKIKEKEGDFAVLLNDSNNETFYFIDHEDRSKILRAKDAPGNSLESITTSFDEVSRIDVKGNTLYLKGCKNGSGCFSCLDLLQGGEEKELLLADEAPKEPYCFLDGASILDDTGSVYVKDDSGENFMRSFQTMRSEAGALGCKSDDAILTNISDDLLYAMNYISGKPVGQYRLEAGHSAEALCAGDESVLLLTKSENECYVTLLTRDSFQELEPIMMTTEKEPMTALEIKEEWGQRTLENQDAADVYLYRPDLSEYQTPGEVSDLVLNDGLKAINFYRRIYGLPDLTIDNNLCEDAQYGSVLALCCGDLADPQKPEAMSDAFYSRAKNVLDASCIDKTSSLTAAPAAEAVDRLFHKSETFRNVLLSDTTSRLGIGVASTTDGETAVLINIPDEPVVFSSDTFAAYPKDGCYPSNWLALSDTWSIKLNSFDVLAGNRGEVSVKITDLATEEVTTITAQNGLRLTEDNTCVSFPAPATKEEVPTGYSILVEDLYTQEGLAVSIEYDVTFIKLKEETPLVPEEQFTSVIYKIDQENKRITGIPPSTTISEFKNGVSYEGLTLKFLNYNNKEVTSGIAGTNMKVRLYRESDQSFVEEYTIIIFGDTTGEGNINNRDTTAVSNYILGKSRLSGAYLLAADVNHDGEVDTIDLLMMTKYIFGEIEILQ